MMMLSNGNLRLLRGLTPFLLASIAVLALSGCGIFSPDESDDGGGGTIQDDFKNTAVDEVSANQGRDNVIANLELAYELLNYEQYERLIHADYVFRVDPNEVDIVGARELTAFEDLESTFAMFNGETGREPILDAEGNPTGEEAIVPPVQRITLDLDPETSAWIESSDPLFEGSFERIYRVTMTVTYSGDSRVDQIRGKQVFYVTPGTLQNDDSGKLYWQLRAWEDQGIDS